MRKHIVRTVAAFTVLAVGTVTLQLAGAPAIAGADATVNIQCDGVSGDVAGSLSGAPKSSKELVALLGTLTKSVGLPPLPVNVTSSAPAKVRKGSGDLDVSFTYNIGFPASMVTALRDQLGKSSLQIVNATIGVDYTGAVSGSMQTQIASQTIDFNGSGSTAVTVTGKIPTDASGRVTFKPGVFTLGAKIDGTAAGIAQVGTLTLTCGSSQTIGATQISVPGSPNVPAVIEAKPIAGGQIGLTPILGRPDITPDDGNPILPETLKVVGQHQGGFVKNGALVQLSTDDGGVFTNEREICAPSRPVPEVPGIDEVQTLKWGDKYFGQQLNAHPLSVTFKFKDVESKPVSLSTNVLGNETLGQFQAPSASAVQKALEGMSTIGAGNIAVTKNADGTYSFAFKGDLGGADQPDITIGTWKTWAPYEQYGQIQAAIAALTAPKPAPDPNAPADPGETDLTVEQLQAELLKGAITFDQFAAKFGSALGNSIIKGIPVTAALDFINSIYPAIPSVTTTTVGEPLIPATETGPLCSQFSVRTVAVSKVFLFYVWLQQNPQVLACTQQRVPYKAKVRRNGRIVTVTKYKVVKKNCNNKKATTKKKVTKRR